MKELDFMHELAIKYFEGKLNREDEAALYAFLKDEEAGRLFGQWEEEWKLQNIQLSKVDESWQRMQLRMKTRQATQHLTVIAVAPFYRRSWFKAISIAAAFLLVMMSTWLVNEYVYHSIPSTYYVSSAEYGERSKVTLTDGTQVWLNAGSSLKYSNHFGISNREVFLEGEGYFEVQKAGGQEFVVHTDQYDVVVKGTKFNVSAYPDDSYIATTLLEGKVEVAYEDQVWGLEPGEQLSFDRNSATFTRSNVDALLAKAWSENRIEYTHITLRELVVKLSRQYNVSIQLNLSSEEVAERSFHISLRNGETVDEVLAALQHILPIVIERTGRNIVISSRQ